MKIKIIMHKSLIEKYAELQDMEVEIEDNKTIGELLIKVGIQDLDSIMVLGNENILKKNTLIREIYEIKLYPVVQGG